MTDIFSLRREFALKTLDEHEVMLSPIDFFRSWFDEAVSSEALEPNAMNLATVNAEGRPSSRIVLLKQIKEDGFVFFTNYDSRKAQDIACNKYCALNFVWHELERQVRIEGIVEKISEEESDSYFEMRPLKSKLGAWVSPQSKIIPDRAYLEGLIADFESKLGNTQISRPENWGGYIVKPNLIEFWQGRESRLHDRIQYTKTDDSWKIERLAP